MTQSTKVAIEEELFLYARRMLDSFADAEMELFPKPPKTINVIRNAAGRIVRVWWTLDEHDRKHWNEIESAGAICVRRIDKLLGELCSSAAREDRTVTCVMLRDKVFASLSQVSDIRLSAQYQQFLERDPAAVIAKGCH